jgi:hypothetical protein
VFNNLYHVGPGYVDACLIPTSAAIIMIDTAQERFVDHVIDNIRTRSYRPLPSEDGDGTIDDYWATPAFFFSSSRVLDTSIRGPHRQ